MADPDAGSLWLRLRLLRHLPFTGEAQAEIERTLGHPIEPPGDIRISPGHQRDVWVGNVVAIRLASSFVEPLEGTSIHGTIGQLICLAEWMDQPDSRAGYNATAARRVTSCGSIT